MKEVAKLQISYTEHGFTEYEENCLYKHICESDVIGRI